jgi:hypothetical protein
MFGMRWRTPSQLRLRDPTECACATHKRKSTVARENCTHPKGIEYVKYVGGYELSDGGFHATFSCRCPVCFTEIPLTCSGSKEYVENFHAEIKAKKLLDY